MNSSYVVNVIRTGTLTERPIQLDGKSAGNA